MNNAEDDATMLIQYALQKVKEIKEQMNGSMYISGL